MNARIARSLHLVGFLFAASITAAKAEPKKPPRAPNLVLAIVVDQFRADYLTRFPHLLSDRGFKRLMKLGATFPNTQYDILQSMTGPGHAIISTGTNPHYSGIAANTWWDVETSTRMYCVADPKAPLLPETAAKPGQGISPRNLIASTFGDELKNAGFPSRVVAIALKDRAAVLMGGHRADLALWFHEPSKQWATSRYYLNDGKLPAFVEILNSSLERRKDRVPDQAALASPYGIQLTMEAVEMAWNHFGFGKRTATDVLAISFSSFDYAGHQHGPNSSEIETMLVAQDKAIASLLDLVEKRVPGGLSKTIVALTADHGVAPVPETLGRGVGGRIDEKEMKSKIEAALIEKFGGVSPGWVLGIESLHVYLNRKAIMEKGLTVAEVETVAKGSVQGDPRIFRIWRGSDLEKNVSLSINGAATGLVGGNIERQVFNTFFPGRSASLLIAPKPFFIPAEANTTHVTGYSYDREVPLVIAGPGIKSGRYWSGARVQDLAPTLSALLGTVAPAMSEGRVLHEAMYAGE